jgi:AraC family transcriptional regulator, positive regulator of tynA and feaB
MSKVNGISKLSGTDAAASAGGAIPRRSRSAETTIGQSGGDLLGIQRLDFEAWTTFVRSNCGDTPEVIEPNAFSAWIRPLSVWGIAAVELKIECGSAAADLSDKAYRSERTHRDVRIAGADYYYAVFQVASRSALTQNDQAVQLAVGDVAVFDAARPATCSADDSQWLCLQLPRQSLVSHLGFEPQGGSYGGGGTLAARLFRQLVLDSVDDQESMSGAAGTHMTLAFYDLLGALLAPPDRWAVSCHADKLFMRIRDVIKDGFALPDFGPGEVAAEMGISLRYLQKLFTQRGSTCSEFIYSLRLNHAAQLLRRRASLGTNQPLSEIAHACGFRDYTHFARKFRHRFGQPPGACAGGHGRAGNETVRAGADDSASPSHDVHPPVI